MKKITVDTNCIIDVEQNRRMAPTIQQLIRLHKGKQLQLQVPAIAASERRPDGSYLSNIQEFLDRIKTLGLADAEILKPLVYFGVTFWGWCVLSGPELEAQEKAIHEILFPGIPFKYADYCTQNGIDPKSDPVAAKWRNAKCDVLALWSHIHYSGDVFVTSDGNFRKPTKLQALESLGAKKISAPEDVLALVL